jgi:pimeloyl-ACP methyl ester carboxylesterase/DNA-binding winged helix-turn-helix (wHTH) protein
MVGGRGFSAPAPGPPTGVDPSAPCHDDVVLVLDGDLELDEELFEVRRSGVRVPLEPQAFDVLLHLVRHRGRVVSKEELMDSIWGGRFVSETAVTSRIKQIRHALGDDGRTQRVVSTLHGRGYRFVASVREILPGSESVPQSGSVREAVARRPVSGDSRGPVRYTVSDGLHIAYQVTGGGDVDIVLIPGFVSHLDVDWDDPRHAYFLDRLGTMGRLIRFDKRGTGMSDRPPGVPDLETRMHDVLAVMDAVGSERAVLCGYSEGGPMAVMMAAMHPERVHSLVLYGSYARRLWAADYPWARTAEERRAHTDRLVASWDWEADLRMRCPSGDEAMQRWWSRRVRAAATPTTVRALMEMNSLVDVRELLPPIKVPTLVLHRDGDALATVDEARYIAEHIPGAELKILHGDDHLVSGDPEQILDAMEPFVAATPREERHFALAAVATVSGPSAGPLLEALERAGGRRRRSTQGDAVVLFDGPATAIRALSDVMDPSDGAGVGLSIAEVAMEGGPVSGPAVEEALRLAGAVPAGRIAVSSLASQILLGSGVELEDAPSIDGRLVRS